MIDLRITLLFAVLPCFSLAYPGNPEVPLETYKQHAIADIIGNYFAYDPFQRHGRDYNPQVPPYPSLKPSPPYQKPYAATARPYTYKQTIRTTPKPATYVDDYYPSKKQSLSYDELKNYYSTKPKKYVAGYQKPSSYQQPGTYRQSSSYPHTGYGYPAKSTSYRKNRVYRGYDTQKEFTAAATENVNRRSGSRQSRTYQYVDVRAPTDYNSGHLRGNSGHYVHEQRVARGHRATGKVL